MNAHLNRIERGSPGEMSGELDGSMVRIPTLFEVMIVVRLFWVDEIRLNQRAPARESVVGYADDKCESACP